MKIISITAGAAGMYCGSCIRDNALASELIAQGHDVALVPLYTPTLTDEDNVSQKKVFFGGISIYLQRYVALFRKTPWLLDRLWDSKLALRAASQRAVPSDPRLLGELTVSVLEGEDGFNRKEFAKLLHWLKGQPPPDVVDISYTLLIGLARPLKRELNRPVFCTLQGEDLFLDGLSEPYRSRSLALIRAHLGAVDGFIATSDYYAQYMSDYLGIPRGRIQVVPVGINLKGYEGARRARPNSNSDTFTVGYFARVAPEKGLDLLAEAYRRMRARPGCPPSRLAVAGYLSPRHRDFLRSIERRMSQWGLGGEFHYSGSPDRAGKIRFLQGLDALSVPSTYGEPKGVFLLEAMAAGVPVVQPRRGVFPEIIEKTSGGLLVEPDDPAALADALLSIWQDPPRAAEFSRAGAQGVRQHYSVARMAARALDVYTGRATTSIPETDPASLRSS